MKHIIPQKLQNSDGVSSMFTVRSLQDEASPDIRVPRLHMQGVGVELREEAPPGRAGA